MVTKESAQNRPAHRETREQPGVFEGRVVDTPHQRFNKNNQPYYYFRIQLNEYAGRQPIRSVLLKDVSEDTLSQIQQDCQVLVSGIQYASESKKGNFKLERLRVLASQVIIR